MGFAWSGFSFLNKHVAVMGTTPGLWGTIRMQMAFLPVFVFLSINAQFFYEFLNDYNAVQESEKRCIKVLSIDLTIENIFLFFKSSLMVRPSKFP